MELSEFKIGDEFECDDRRWRCTDIGTRVVVAIRVDTVEVGVTGEPTRTLNQTQAEAEGWFNGPPYASPEIVFDEYDQEGCEPVARSGQQIGSIGEFKRWSQEAVRNPAAAGGVPKQWFDSEETAQAAHRPKRRDRQALYAWELPEEDIAALEETRAPEASKAFDDELPPRRD